jgi:hypothetical protein
MECLLGAAKLACLLGFDLSAFEWVYQLDFLCMLGFKKLAWK